MVFSGPAGDSLEFTAPESGAAYAVKLSIFEGPLDLLLHLIRLNEVDINDIPIALIAEQYIEYLDVMRELNLDVAGEYLLMAATLAWIKSRTLLPPAEGEEEPRTVEIRGCPLPVEEVLERWREPRGRYFRVVLGDGTSHLLLCRDEDRSWWLVLERGRQR